MGSWNSTGRPGRVTPRIRCPPFRWHTSTGCVRRFLRKTWLNKAHPGVAGVGLFCYVGPMHEQTAYLAHKFHCQNPSATPEENWAAAEQCLAIPAATRKAPRGVYGQPSAEDGSTFFGICRENCVEWLRCREAFEVRWHRPTSAGNGTAKVPYQTNWFTFLSPRPTLEVAALIREMELQLGLQELSLLYKLEPRYCAPSLWIETSGFWKQQPFRIAFFTLFLCLAARLQSVSPEQFDLHAEEQVLASMKAFLFERRVNFSGVYPTTGSHWVKIVAALPPKSLDQFLTT